MAPTPPEAGKSSFDLIDADAFFAALPLASVRRALDLGCGVGRYTLPLAERLEAGASVRGFDLWEEGVAALARAAAERGLTGVSAQAGDLSDLASVGKAEVDLALMATVLHDLAARGTAESALREAARVVRPGGWLAVVEFRKADTRPGPPVAIRLSPEELEALVVPAGFDRPQLVGLGANAYLALFRRAAPA